MEHSLAKTRAHGMVLLTNSIPLQFCRLCGKIEKSVWGHRHDGSNRRRAAADRVRNTGIAYAGEAFPSGFGPAGGFQLYLGPGCSPIFTHGQAIHRSSCSGQDDASGIFIRNQLRAPAGSGDSGQYCISLVSWH